MCDLSGTRPVYLFGRLSFVYTRTQRLPGFASYLHLKVAYCAAVLVGLFRQYFIYGVVVIPLPPTPVPRVVVLSARPGHVTAWPLLSAECFFLARKAILCFPWVWLDASCATAPQLYTGRQKREPLVTCRQHAVVCRRHDVHTSRYIP